jgi:hypothetical protein
MTRQDNLTLRRESGDVNRTALQSKTAFANAYNEIEIRAYQIADYLRQHGTSTLVTQIDTEKEKRGSLFDLALRLSCNGRGRDTVAKFFDMNIEAELDPQRQQLYQITKEAVLGLIDNINPGCLVMKINSHVDFGKADAQFIYDKEMEYLKTPGQYQEELKATEAILAEVPTETKKGNKPQGSALSQDHIDALLDKKKKKLTGQTFSREKVNEIVEEVLRNKK